MPYYENQVIMIITKVIKTRSLDLEFSFIMTTIRIDYIEYQKTQ